MGQSVIGHCLAYVKANIPDEILNITFDPIQNHSTLDSEINKKVIQKDVLADINLIGGRRKIITMNDEWKLDVPDPDNYTIFGSGIGSSFYKVPADQREYRDITQVVGITDQLTSVYSGNMIGLNGNTAGNTVTSELGAMLGSYTGSNSKILPRATEGGTNIIKFFPQLIVTGVAVTVMLAYDADFNNMQVSATKALRNLVLCATKRYIANFLIIKVDSFYAAAGMEIGVVKDLITEYKSDAENYDPLLIRCKGAMHWDISNLDQEIYFRL